MTDSCNTNCSSCAQECSDRKEKNEFLVDLNVNSKVKKVIGIVSGKGGVGKSLVTSMIASKMSKDGHRVGILDADITGPSIPKAFGMKPGLMQNTFGLLPAISNTGIQVMSINLMLENETDPVVWRGPVIGNTVKQFWSDVFWDDVEYMFVDMPPGTGDVPLTVFQSIRLDGIIIVTSPQELVSMIVAKAVNMAKKMNIPIVGLVENMSYFVCDSCEKKHYIYGESNLEKIAEEYNLPILARIPMDPNIATACDNGNIEAYEHEFFHKLVKAL